MKINHFSYLLILLWAFTPATPIYAGEESVEAGIAAVEKQDYMNAYQIFKSLAEQGNAEAQHNLAILYRQGKGVMQDSKLAAEWFRKAADQGLPSAQYYLGHMYDVGEGVAKNSELAVQWYQKAAEQGNPMAQTNLGVAYIAGEGVKQDIILAYVWFSLAASQGLTAALENRNELKKEMSEELVQNAQRLTREYFSKYVAPFQPQASQFAGNSHPRIQGAHQQPGPATPPPTGQMPAAGHPPSGHGDEHKH
ncbi:tetratricopeptide repeat protein [Kaarinaea lacus]